MGPRTPHAPAGQCWLSPPVPERRPEAGLQGTGACRSGQGHSPCKTKSCVSEDVEEGTPQALKGDTQRAPPLGRPPLGPQERTQVRSCFLGAPWSSTCRRRLCRALGGPGRRGRGCGEGNRKLRKAGEAGAGRRASLTRHTLLSSRGLQA